MLSLCKIGRFGLRRHMLYAVCSNYKLQCRLESRAKVQAEATAVDSNPKILPIPNPTAKEQVTTTKTVQPAKAPASVTAIKEETGLIGATTLNPQISGPMIVEEKVVVKKEPSLAATPFDEVPGPVILKLMAKLHSRLPLLGNQLTVGAMSYFLNMLGSNLIWNRSRFAFTHMFDKYGPVVRLQGIFGGDIVFISRPEHIEAVYQHEGQHPVRSSLDSLDTYRRQHRQLRIVGPYLMSGPEWEALRLKLEEPLQKRMTHFHSKMELIADLMVNRICKIRNRQEEVPATFNDEIYKWALENISGVVMGWYLGLLSSEDLDGALESARLLEAVKNASLALRSCESGFQTWRFIKNRTWRKLVNSCDVIDSIVVKYIRLAQQQLNNKKNAKLTKEAIEKEFGTSVLESLLLAENMHPEDILTVILDMLIIGVNATSHALVFLLYHLSKSPKVQRKAFEELLQVMPCKNSPISYEDVKKLTYLHACVKESLRLQPPLPVITRILPEDIVVHNYRIPKGTFMLMATHVTTLKDEYFEDPLKFEPERWLSESSGIHPFAAIPFGHGPRSCVGKGIAELQLWLSAAKIIRNFSIEYNYGTIQSEARLIAMPKKPLKFRFVDRAK